MKEKEYEYMTLIKSHKELFTYDIKNDIYHSEMFSMSIGNKRQLQKLIERFCKSRDDKEKVGKLFSEYTNDDILTANYDRTGRCAILPLIVAFEGKDIKKELQELREKNSNDKYSKDNIEAKYDNDLSFNENTDIKEEKTSVEKVDEIDNEISEERWDFNI